MTENAQRLSRLLQVAELKAERALQDLAEVLAKRDGVQARIAGIDNEISRALDDARDPVSQRIALRYGEMKRELRSELVAELARVELQRKAALKTAQQNEGRRIALQQLRSQAS